MKKKLSFLLAMVLMLTAVLAGCGNGAGTGSGDVFEDNDAEYQIKWFSAGDKSKDHDLVFEEISKYTKEKINATVTQTLIPGAEYGEKIQMLLFGGEEIDLMFASNFPNLVSDEIYAPLDGLLETYGQDILKTLPEYVWKAVSVDGQVYAVPPLKDWAVEPVLLYYDGLTEKYNFDFSTVKEIKDLEPMLQTIKDNEPGVSPLGLRGAGDGFGVFLPIERVRNSGIAGFHTGNYDKVINVYETQEYKDYFDLMRRWHEKGFFTSDAATATTISDKVAAHQVYMLTSEQIPYFQQQKNKIEDEGWKTIFDNRLSQPVINTRAVAQACQAITADSANPARTMKFLNMMYTDANLMNLIVHGIEGKHYTKLDDTYLRYPEGVVNRNKNDYYGSPAYQGNRFLLLLNEGEPADLWEQYAAFNDKAYISPSYGFNFDSTDVMNELTAINNVHAEYMPNLFVGATDPAVKLPEALEKFKVAGSETVIAEIQAQYDAWKAANN